MISIVGSISASDAGYAYDPVAPVITFGPSIPVTKIHNSLITIPVTIKDNYKVLTSGVGISATTAATITTPVQVADGETTFSILVTGEGTHDFVVTATDFVGLSTSALTSGYQITSAYSPDYLAPYITFSEQNPSNRTIMSRGELVDSVSGTVYENTGRLKVTVFDPDGSIAPSETNIGLAPGSVGYIDYSSLKQTIFPHTIEFDVWNISATGDVIVSAQDDSRNWTSASDGQWVIGCGANDKLINLTEFLPTHLKGESVFDFLQFFENFLNTLYTKSGDTCNHSILKKIERLSSLHNPEDIDMEYLEFFASMMGYGVGLNAGDLGLFTIGNADPTDADEIAEQNRALRFVVENLPNWYRIKSTRNAIKIMLYSFGIIGDVLYQYSNDYQNNWVSYDDNEQVNIKSVVPADYYPTPHFSLNVNIGLTTPNWITQIDEIINAINSIRPINSVFDHIAASLKITAERTGMNVNLRNTYIQHLTSDTVWTIELEV